MGGGTDYSTIAPPKTSDLLQRTFHGWLLDTKKDDMKNTIFISFLVCKERSVVGGARVTVFQEIRPGAAFRTRRFPYRNVGGATVEALGRGVKDRQVLRRGGTLPLHDKGPKYSRPTGLL